MVQVTVCERCRVHDFPAKLRCRRCGGTVFSQQPITEARVVGFTEVFRPASPNGWRWLLDVEAPPGLKLIAASSFEPVAGQVVRLHQQDDGAVVAQLAPADRGRS